MCYGDDFTNWTLSFWWISGETMKILSSTMCSECLGFSEVLRHYKTKWRVLFFISDVLQFKKIRSSEDGARLIPVQIKHYSDAPGVYTVFCAITGRGTVDGVSNWAGHSVMNIKWQAYDWTSKWCHLITEKWAKNTQGSLSGYQQVHKMSVFSVSSISPPVLRNSAASQGDDR